MVGVQKREESELVGGRTGSSDWESDKGIRMVIGMLDKD